jgi:hypothetical protein
MFWFGFLISLVLSLLSKLSHWPSHYVNGIPLLPLVWDSPQVLYLANDIQIAREGESRSHVIRL